MPFAVGADRIGMPLPYVDIVFKFTLCPLALLIGKMRYSLGKYLNLLLCC